MLKKLIGLALCVWPLVGCSSIPAQGDLTHTVPATANISPTTTAQPTDIPSFPAATMTEQPTATIVPLPNWAASAPFVRASRGCGQVQLTPPKHELAGKLLVVTGDQDDKTYGVYELVMPTQRMSLVAHELNTIAKIEVSYSGKWIVYSTQCATSACSSARSDDPLEWVLVSWPETTTQRFPWSGEYDAFSWDVVKDNTDGVEIVRLPDLALENFLADASLLELPSGSEKPFPVNAVLPNAFDAGERPVVAFDSTTSKVVYYSFDLKKHEASTVLFDLKANESRWAVTDQLHIAGMGYGYNWVWSPDDKLIALSKSSVSPNTNSRQVDVFVVDSGSGNVLQFTDLSKDGLAEYFVRPVSWSPDGKKLAVLLFVPQQPEQLLVVDTTNKRILDTCYSGSENTVWSPDSRFLAVSTINSNRDDPLIIIDTDSGQAHPIARRIRTVAAWLP